MLGPLVDIFAAGEDRKLSVGNVQPKNRRSVSSEYEPQHVCELCHRVYKLYEGKCGVLMGYNVRLMERLQLLSGKPQEDWTAEDVRYIMDVYGHTLPAVKVSPGAGTEAEGVRRRGNVRHRSNFYGYQSIMETPLAPLDWGESSSKVGSTMEPAKQNYVKLNMRCSSMPRASKKSTISRAKSVEAKIPKFENSAAPKVMNPEDISSLYRSAETVQRNLVARLRDSIHKGYLE